MSELCASAIFAVTLPWSSKPPIFSAPPSAITSPMENLAPPWTKSAPALGTPPLIPSSPRCPKLTTPSSASGATPCPPASGSALLSPALFSAILPFSSWTSQPPRSTLFPKATLPMRFPARSPAARSSSSRIACLSRKKRTKLSSWRMAGSFRKEFPASCFMCKEGWDTTFKLREVPFRRPYDCAGTHRHDRHRRQLHAPSCRQHLRRRHHRYEPRDARLRRWALPLHCHLRLAPPASPGSAANCGESIRPHSRYKS